MDDNDGGGCGCGMAETTAFVLEIEFEKGRDGLRLQVNNLFWPIYFLFFHIDPTSYLFSKVSSF